MSTTLSEEEGRGEVGRSGADAPSGSRPTDGANSSVVSTAIAASIPNAGVPFDTLRFLSRLVAKDISRDGTTASTMVRAGLLRDIIDMAFRAHAAEAELARRDDNEARNCINWGPCSRNDGRMSDGSKP